MQVDEMSQILKVRVGLILVIIRKFLLVSDLFVSVLSLPDHHSVLLDGFGVNRSLSSSPILTDFFLDDDDFFFVFFCSLSFFVLRLRDIVSI